jgi:hypothetical protein
MGAVLRFPGHKPLAYETTARVARMAEVPPSLVRAWAAKEQLPKIRGAYQWSSSAVVRFLDDMIALHRAALEGA